MHGQQNIYIKSCSEVVQLWELRYLKCHIVYAPEPDVSVGDWFFGSVYFDISTAWVCCWVHISVSHLIFAKKRAWFKKKTVHCETVNVDMPACNRTLLQEAVRLAVPSMHYISANARVNDPLNTCCQHLK